jgi:hypothetical protein
MKMSLITHRYEGLETILLYVVLFDGIYNRRRSRLLKRLPRLWQTRQAEKRYLTLVVEVQLDRLDLFVYQTHIHSRRAPTESSTMAIISKVTYGDTISRSRSQRKEISVRRLRPSSHFDPSLYSSNNRLPRKYGKRFARLLLTLLIQVLPNRDLIPM